MLITNLPLTETLNDASVFPVDGFADGTKAITADSLASEILSRMDGEAIFNALDLNDLTVTSELDNTDKFLVGKEAAKNTIQASDLLYATVDAMGGDKSALKKVLFRGKDLGSTFTDAQKEAIKDGSFKGLFLGDYWTIGGHHYRIADFNYFRNVSSAKNMKPHIMIIPDNRLDNAIMDSSRDTTSMRYGGTSLHTTGIDTAASLVYAAFGTGFVYSHTEYIEMSKGSYSSGGQTIEVPDLIMVNGSVAGSLSSITYKTSRGMLALFQVRPDFRTSNGEYWLRDVMISDDTNGAFAIVDSNGCISTGFPNGTKGVRPCFPIAHPNATPLT